MNELEKKIRKHLNEVVQDIRVITKKSKYGVNSFLKLTLKDGRSSEVKIENDFTSALQALAQYEGQPVKSKKLIEDISTKDSEEPKIYMCIEYILNDENNSRNLFMIPYSFQIAINAFYKSLHVKK